MRIKKDDILELGFTKESEYRRYFEYHKTENIFIRVYKFKVNGEWLALFCNGSIQTPLESISHLRQLLFNLSTFS